MYKIKATNQFKKDLKLAKRRNMSIEKIKNIMRILSEDEKLGPRYKDHILQGDYINCRECHIESDWLLIYKIEADNIIFERTGTHSDLFK